MTNFVFNIKKVCINLPHQQFLLQNIGNNRDLDQFVSLMMVFHMIEDFRIWQSMIHQLILFDHEILWMKEMNNLQNIH
jgi:hypothetical protein